MQNYNFAAAYVMQTYLHSPMAAEWMAGYQRFYRRLVRRDDGEPSARVFIAWITR